MPDHAPPSPAPVLQSYRLTDTHLTLHLTLDGAACTRSIRLGERDAGLVSYSDLDGLGLFAAGRVDSKADAYRPLRDELLVTVTPEQAAALAAEVWPVMRRLARE